jgi:predicted Zn-dependent peptidase
MKYKKLANDLQVIYEKTDSSIPISSVQIFINIGSIHSPSNLKGVTHFIEHMCLKGTTQHPDFNKVILQYVDIGATYNAYSLQNYTVFVLKCQDQFLPQCIKLLAEELLHSNFALSDFKKEEKVVIEENIIRSDNPHIIMENMTNTLLYENTPFQYPVDDITYHKKKYDYQTVLDFYKTHYVPSNMIFSVTSNVSFKSILQNLKTAGFDKKLPPRQLAWPSIMPPRLGGVKYNIKHMKKINSIFLHIAFQTCDQLNADKYVLNFFANVLCNSLSSRLNKILRQDHGLVYGIVATTYYSECGGDFTIASQFNPISLIQKNKPSVLPLIIKELNHLLQDGINQHELTLIKHNMRGRILIDLENSDTQTMYNGISLLYLSPEEIVPYSKLYKTYYEPITKAQVNACIRKYFSLDRMCVSVLGNAIPPLAVITAECNNLKN